MKLKQILWLILLSLATINCLAANLNRSDTIMTMPDNSHTFCVGRVLIDLPEEFALNQPAIASSIENNLSLDVMTITTQTGVSFETYKQLIQDRWLEVQSYTHDSSGKPYDKSPQQMIVRDNGIIFTYKYRPIRSNGRWVNGQRVFDREVIYDTEGYYWDNGTLFTIQSSYPSVAEKISNTIHRMHYRAMDEIPEQPGICLNGGFIETLYKNQYEMLIWSAEISPELRFALILDSSVRDKPLLERRGRASMAPRSYVDEDSANGEVVIRAQTRQGDQLPAQELIISSTEGILFPDGDGQDEYTTFVGARWEYLGEESSSSKPYVRADLGLTITSNNRPQVLGQYPSAEESTFPTKDEYLALWDSIVRSIRFYPGALTPPPSPPPRETMPGPNAQQQARDRQVLDDFINGKTY